MFVMRNPGKNYGKMELNETVLTTILATDYKSPPLCLIVYEEDDKADKCDR